MAISSKTRKNLWAKSGNRCAICKTELFIKTSEKVELNIGEECHIISSKLEGPRHKNIANYDEYYNLILLCRNHHKEIDELYDTYTEEILRYIKLNHENWVKRSLEKSNNNPKRNRPRFLMRITSGKELLSILYGVHGYKTDYDEIQDEEEARFIGGILQDLTDYGDLSGSVEIYDQVQMELHLKNLIESLEENGYFLFGERNIEKVKFGDGSMDNWAVATILIRKKENDEIIKVDLNDKSVKS